MQERKNFWKGRETGTFTKNVVFVLEPIRTNRFGGCGEREKEAFERNFEAMNGSEDPNHVDPWIRAQLSAQQVLWLQKQSGVVRETELLKSALAEWVVRHPIDWFTGTRVSDAIRLALTEFIARHKDEFLS
jgi:hypothetical protein